MRVLILVFIFFVCGGMAFAQKVPIVKTYGKGAGGYYFLHIKKFMVDSATKTLAPVQLILDGSGNIVFYRTIENASDFKVYPNGMMSFFYLKNYYLMDSAFRIIDSVSCVNGIQTDNHEFRILPNGNYLLLGKEETEMDLSAFPIFLHRGIRGSRHAKVITGVVQELNAKKELVYEWRSKAYFDIQKADTFFLNDTLLVDMTHFNSVAVTPDSNWLISVRYYNEVIKVNKQNGSIIWRLGGQNNQFSLQRDSVFFLAQHDAREIKPGIISLFDNGYAPAQKKHATRAVEYKLDTVRKTVTLTWSYTFSDNLITEFAGSSQKLPNGNRVINYGKIAKGSPEITFVVVTPKGKKLMEYFAGDTMGSYRTFGCVNLPESIKQPEIVARQTADGSYVLHTNIKGTRYRWSTGDTTETIQVTKPGTFYVYVSVDGTGFLRSHKFELKTIKGRKKRTAG